jgi:hypothetical protein
MKCENRDCFKEAAEDYCSVIMTKPSHPLSLSLCKACYIVVYHLIRINLDLATNKPG